MVDRRNQVRMARHQATGESPVLVFLAGETVLVVQAEDDSECPV